MESKAVCSCLLLGQPRLRWGVRPGGYAALNQRVALRYVIGGMSKDETGAHIAHHLKLALFTELP